VRRLLHWKRLLVVVAVFLALGGAVFALHRLQAGRQSAVIRDRAEKAAAADGDPARREEAIRLYERYLKFRPDDEAAYRAYATLLLESVAPDSEPAALQRVAAGLERFLRAFPNHPAQRQKLAELYVRGGLLTTARQHIEMLLAAPGGDSRASVELLELAAACEHGLGELTKAVDYLEEAIRTGRAPARVYQQAMALLHQNKADPQRNGKIAVHMDTLLNDPRFRDDLAARVGVARFQLFRGEPAEARKNVTHALTAIPGGADDPETLLAAAEVEIAEINSPDQTAAQLKKAEAHLRKAFKADARNVDVGMKLAEVLARQGNRDEGVKVLRATAAGLGPVNDRYLTLVDRLIDLGERETSAGMTDRLAVDRARRWIAAYFRGRLAVLAQEWQAALRHLDESAPHLVRLPTFHKKAMTGMAACYAALQNPDKQLEYCRLALRDDAGYAPAVVGEAEALAKTGKLDEALRRYRAIVHLYQLTDYRADLVRLELLDVLTRPADAGARDWTRFEESLGPPQARTPEIHILHAEALAARGSAAEAVKLLQDWLAAHKDDPKRAAVWVALSRVKDGGKGDAALAVLNDAEKQVGDAVELRLARAGLLVVRAKPPAPAEFDALSAGADKFPKLERFRLWSGLGQAAGRVADMLPDGEPSRALRASALTYLRNAADLLPADLGTRALLLDHALTAGRPDVVERALKEMAAVEGDNGPVGNLGRIAARLPEVRNIADAGSRAAAIKELRETARRVRELRPGWSRIYVAMAQLDEIEGLTDAALENYREAIDRGDRQEVVIRRAIDLLRDRKQDDVAVAVLDKLATEVRLPDDLERYRAIRRMIAELEAGGLPAGERATIDRIAPASSDDPRLQMLRGELLAAIRADADALAAFRRAVEVRDGYKMPETWAALVGQLVRHNRTDDAKRAVAEAEQKLTPKATKLSAAERLLALGRLHELVGDLKAALARYDAARRAAPLELNPTRQLVLFFQQAGQFAKADAILRQAKDSTAQEVARWARRHLALTLMARTDAYHQRAEALALVERNLAAAPDPEDVKARAVIWTVDPATREDGARVLRQFGDRGDLTPDEFHLLGRLSFERGRFAEAEKYFKLAARLRPGVTPEHMAALVRVYVVLGRIDLAENALERLKANAPASWEAVREEARLLHRKSKDRAAAGEAAEAKKLLDQARGVIVKHPGWDSAASLAVRSGPLFEELGLTADAEAAYKKFLADSGLPNAHAPLAVFYVRQKRPEEAIKLAREFEAKVPPDLTAQLLTGAVRMKRPGAAAEAEIDRWLADRLRAAAGNARLEAALIGSRAELLDAQGKYTEAIREYRRSVAKHRGERTVNNLCMLLALHEPEKAEEAVRMMTELIAVRGPIPAYLDTRAVAYLVSSRPAEAAKDLEMALVQTDRAAYHFHLAWALDLDLLEARRVFAVDELMKAKRLGLSAADLHPLELEKYRALMVKYKLPADEK
jgi:tetratricopeptide (TPR) repeat protein